MKQQSNYYYGNSSKSDLQILLVLVMDVVEIVVYNTTITSRSTTLTSVTNLEI